LAVHQLRRGVERVAIAGQPARRESMALMRVGAARDPLELIVTDLRSS